MSELIAGLLGALIGGGLTYAGSLAQARGARDIAILQAEAARAQWIRSSKENTFITFIEIVREFELHAKEFSIFLESYMGRPEIIRSVRHLKGYASEAKSLQESWINLHDTLVVIELHAPSEVSSSARTVRAACQRVAMMVMECSHDRERRPNFATWSEARGAIGDALTQFVATAGMHLRDDASTS